MIERTAPSSGPRMDRADKVGGGFRSDRAPLRSPFTTVNGALVADAYTAKPGILEYIEPDGTTFRELVPAATLHAEASLASLKLCPLTLEHPDPLAYPDMVTPDNVGILGVGTVGEDVAIDDDGHVRFRVAVNRADALAWIEDRRKRGLPVEVSPGYLRGLDRTPGVDPQFGPYDGIQTWRVYNHLALTEQARGGATVRLRVDASREEAGQRTDAVPLTEALISAGVARADALRIVKSIDDGTITAKLDGANALAALEDAHGKLRAKADEMKAELDEMKAQAAKDAEEEEPDAEEEEAKADAIRRAADELVEVRATALRFDALTESGKLTEEARKLDAAALRAKVIEVAGVKVPEDLTGVALDAYTRARFDALTPSDGDASGTTERDARLDGIRFRQPEARQDGEPTTKPIAVRLDGLGGYRKQHDQYMKGRADA